VLGSDVACGQLLLLLLLLFFASYGMKIEGWNKGSNICKRYQCFFLREFEADEERMRLGMGMIFSGLFSS